MFLDARINYWDLPDPMRWAIGLWLFAFGACAGSFLNVVIWRLPLGRSVVYPGSRCPNCGHAVRSYDNIPILNWLVLRGRCRDCGSGISWRYPAVETLIAVLFVVIALVEPLNEGRNLPRFPAASAYDTSGLILLWGFYFEQMLLICTLIGAAFMWFDGHRPPERFFAPMALVGLLASLVSPALRPEQWVESWLPLSARVSVGAESLVGFPFAGLLAAIAAATVYPRVGSWKSNFTPALWEAVGCTLVFGISSTARIAVLAALFAVPLAILSRFLAAARLVPWTALLAGAAVLHVPFWKLTVNWQGTILHDRQWLVAPIGIAVFAVLSCVAKILRRGIPEYASGWNRDWPIRR